jgi:hypothetical protein
VESSRCAATIQWVTQGFSRARQRLAKSNQSHLRRVPPWGSPDGIRRGVSLAARVDLTSEELLIHSDHEVEAWTVKVPL